MYHIVMCDDEPWALKGIENIIDWSAYGFSSVKTFARSEDALQEILSSNPEVVLTDVCMPTLTGLDLIERSRAAGCTSLFVVVSAYAEFEYAKRALNSGAFSYILKPMEEDKIAELACSLRAVLNQRTETALQQSMRSFVLRTLTSGKAAGANPALEKSGLFAAPYRICAAGSVPAGSAAPWFPIYEDLAISPVPEGMENGLPASYGFSERAEDGGNVPRHIREALIAYYSLRFWGEKTGSGGYRSSDGRSAQTGSDICRAIAEGSLTRAGGLLSEYEAHAHEKRLMIDELTFFYNGLLSGLFGLFPDSELQDDLQPFSSCFQMVGVLQTAENLFESLHLIIRAFLDRSVNAAGPSDVMEPVVRYVDEHYQELLTLEQLAERFSLSLSHLCRQFKRAAGVSFVEYITQKRIAHACELLEHTALAISDVSEQSGYADSFYFSKVFKKATGVSPMRFRKERRHDEA